MRSHTPPAPTAPHAAPRPPELYRPTTPCARRLLVWSDEGRQLPPGVNAAQLETYLSTSQFAEVLGMDRPRFYALSRQDQMRCKQSVGLF